MMMDESKRYQQMINHDFQTHIQSFQFLFLLDFYSMTQYCFCSAALKLKTSLHLSKPNLHLRLHA